MPTPRSLYLLAPAFALLAVAQPAAAQCTGSTKKLFDDRKYDEARKEAEALAQHNDNDAAAHYCVGRIAYAQGQSGKAVDWIEKAIDRDQNVAEYHLWLGNA